MVKKALLKSLSVWYSIFAITWLINFTYLVIYQNSKEQSFSQIKTMAVYPLFIIVALIIRKPKDLFQGKLIANLSFLKSVGIKPFRGKLWLTVLAFSSISLFAELTIIRLHSTYFPVFAFYKNISLFSCFLGLGIGFAMVRKKKISVALVLPLFILQILFIDAVSNSPLEPTLLNPVPEHFTMGLGGFGNFESAFSVYVFIVIIFVFNAFCFIPLGQIVARYMEKNDNKLISYAWNLLGSLTGIIAFSLLSFLSAPPMVWFIVFALSIIIFLRKNPSFLVTSFTLVCLTILFISPQLVSEVNIYSPYQALRLSFGNRITYIEANKTYFQKIVDLREKSVLGNVFLEEWADYYKTPFKIKPQAKDVLIVGSGVGNDVAAAVRSGVVNIDAVEIDPTLIKISKLLHPETPYLSTNVHVIVGDARAYIKNTNKNYDLIIYGVLDSHTLLSGQSSVRLDSFVYTTEAFEEARQRLKSDGIVILTFAGGKEIIGKKLYLMLKEAFDGKKPKAFQTKNLTFIAGDNLSEDINSIFNQDDLSEYYEKSVYEVDEATDDWPFFYMIRKSIPFPAIFLVFLLFIASLLLLTGFLEGNKRVFSATSFFLGSGFMLIEAKGITELALYYGTTWFVNSVVISFILILAFFSNLIVINVKNINKTFVYFMLLLSLLVGYFISFHNNSFSMNFATKVIFSFLITLPIFFSGLAFSAEIKKINTVSVLLFSNLIGSMLGGFLEYSSMYCGYRFLYVIAIFIYLMAFISSKFSISSG